MPAVRNIEVTNLGNAYLMPQFSDAEEVLAHLRSDKFKTRCQKKGIDYDDLTITAVTIREPAVDRAIELAKKGVGPDRCPDDGLQPRRSITSPTRAPPCPTTGRSANGPLKNAATPASRCAVR